MSNITLYTIYLFPILKLYYEIDRIHEGNLEIKYTFTRKPLKIDISINLLHVLF